MEGGFFLFSGGGWGTLAAGARYCSLTGLLWISGSLAGEMGALTGDRGRV